MKIKQAINSMLEAMRFRDIMVLYVLLAIEAAFLYLIDINITFLSLQTICKLFNITLFTLCMVFVFVARWYKMKCDRSLLFDLIDPDNHGNLFQLLVRAKRYPKIQDKNLSKGENLTLGRDGIILGKTEQGQMVSSPSGAEEHIAVFGGSGSGKTSAVLIPTAKKFIGSKFIIDVSGDITKELRKDEKIILISPDDYDSAAFDIFFAVDAEKDRSKKMIMLKQIADIVVPEDIPTLVGDGCFYQRSAHQLFYASLIYFYDKGFDFCDLCYTIHKFNSETLVREINARGSVNAKFALNGIGDVRDYILGNIKQTLDSQLSLFSTSRKVRRVLHREVDGQKTISASILERENIVLNIPQDEVSFYSSLMKLISGMVILYCTKRPLMSGRRILVALDEFPILGFLSILEPLRTLRKHNTRIMILTQSLSDIEYIYGKVATRIIMDNCGIKLVLNSSDVDTNRYLSALIGQKEVVNLTRTYDASNSRHSYSTQFRPSVSPEEFSRLNDELIAILPDGYLRLKKAYYWKN